MKSFNETDIQTIQKRVNEIEWFHRIDLGNGIVTPGFQDSQAKLKMIHLPESLVGKAVLDIGAWDGFFSFEAERRGASRVLAVDSDKHSWTEHPSGTNRTGKQGFLLAREVLGSKVEDDTMEVIDITPERVGQFDIVLFLGVIYHLMFPFYCLSRIATVAKELLVVESDVMNCKIEKPMMQFCPDRFDGDPTNWWYPNSTCIEDMLRVVGFTQIERFPKNFHDDRCRMTFHAYNSRGVRKK